MAQSVVYADLKFATAPPVTAPSCPAAPDEDDSPYENVPLGTVTAAPSPGRWHRRWRIPARLLAASLLLLLLLLLVATVALGACYWQVTRSLQDASREHAAEQGRLSQEASAREQSLERTRLELAWARAELQRAWREGNSSQLELGSLNAELGRARQELAVLEQEVQEVQRELRASESSVGRLRACVNTDCCPSGWVLYRSRCLFISVEKKTWWDSYYDCTMKSARLLVQGDWPSWTVPHFVQVDGATYWIGARVHLDMKNSVVWLDSKQSYLYKNSGDCGISYNGKIESSKCLKRYQWICEQPPKLSSASKTLLPLLVDE
ncbi:B-cell differentiation antigen CD72-like isoform X2 [Accipiter gentilis]|uniref:B-cell differentiation antigen CD72-like isoform X2 n=1 Tax=Astur gentilis TaxID=8957 RepID=UPI00210FAAC4|nr:B-cell differentiation antigen CD72-like isoform X2 [Accipiter gentilis]